MAFNPFREHGTPVDKQIKDWGALNSTPYDKNTVHPYTRTRIILMNGIEVEGAMFNHQMARHTYDADLKRRLALTRRLEQQQQKQVNWLLPGDESPLEVTVGYEQVAVDLTAWQARTEPDAYVKAAHEFALIEDFDHLYRYSNLLQMMQDKDAADIVGDLTEIFPGRPTIWEHRHPFDTVRRHIDSKTAHPITKLHILTIVAAEQQTMNFYMNAGNQLTNHIGRGLYQEIGMIEEQHVTHYESLDDPNTTWFERLVLHEYNECFMYYSCMQSEVDERIRRIWEENVSAEVEHLRLACELMKQYEKKDPESLLPSEFPELTIFESNKDYVRHVIETQINLTADGPELVSSDQLAFDAPYYQYQKAVNEGGTVPSQDVIEENIAINGQDYRLETEGLHPVEWLRIREEVSI